MWFWGTPCYSYNSGPSMSQSLGIAKYHCLIHIKQNNNNKLYNKRKNTHYIFTYTKSVYLFCPIWPILRAHKTSWIQRLIRNAPRPLTEEILYSAHPYRTITPLVHVSLCWHPTTKSSNIPRYILTPWGCVKHIFLKNLQPLPRVEIEIKFK